ncbi:MULTISPECIES: hypothetical protein [unclassified Crossiella]|uniref:hypothetical protein n=1 Tax=unclassified Crossiella TaxID=2620835 RepID=UPI0020001F30|nr:MULTISPECIES: hypothetical protein [unclassified Crossiella]MCK2236347.1 hypothetical protein [Crossiella sp. S99.2]MCK2250014.1 hypothetical protein [Crossiella sp. S99.1]
MQPIPPAVVAQPVTDRPAIEDPDAAAIRNYRQLAVRNPLLGTLACAGLGLVMYLLDFGPGVWAPILVATVLLGALLVWMAVWYAPRLRKAQVLMTKDAWRQAPAAVLGLDGKHFVVEAEGRRLRIPEIGGRVAHRVVGRTGRLWLLGPDPSGLVLARVDGLGTALWGRELTGPGNLEPVPAESFGSAAADPVTIAWAEVLRRAVRYRVWPYMITFGLLALILLSFVAIQGVTTAVVIVCVLVLGVSFPILLRRHLAARRRFQPWDDLPELVRAGAWQPVGISLAPWRPPMTGTADAHGVIRLADGAELQIRLPDAGPALIGNIQQVGGLWVAGEPVPGKLFAVGYPGFPVLGLATFSQGMRPV